MSSFPVPRQLLSREWNREQFGEEMEIDSKASAAAGGETEWWLGRMTFSSLLFWTQDAGTRPHFLAGKDVVGYREWHDVVANFFLGVLCFRLCPYRPLSPECWPFVMCVFMDLLHVRDLLQLGHRELSCYPLQPHFSGARACRVALPLRLQLSGRVASALPRHLTMLSLSLFLRMFFLDDCNASSLDRACLPHRTGSLWSLCWRSHAVAGSRAHSLVP